MLAPHFVKKYPLYHVRQTRGLCTEQRKNAVLVKPHFSLELTLLIIIKTDERLPEF